MNGIFRFLGAFCISSAVFGALYILLPSGSFSKPLKYTFGVCFLCIILTTFSFSLKSAESYNFEQQNVKTEDFSAKTAELTYKTALKNAGLEVNGLTVLTSKSETGGITIKEITIYSPEPKEKIEKVIGNHDFEVRVINE